MGQYKAPSITSLARMRKAYVTEGKYLDKIALSNKFKIPVHYLEKLITQWDAEIEREKQIQIQKEKDQFEREQFGDIYKTVKPETKQDINKIRASLADKATLLQAEILDTMQKAIKQVSRIVSTNPDGLYVKSTGLNESYGRNSEFIKDLLPALQLIKDFKDLNGAIGNDIPIEQIKELPNNAIEAARTYSDIMKAIL